MVIIKLIVVVMVIAIGFFYVKPENWTPFLPEGWSGVLAGVSAVFFAYIGFDAISTTAEECKNPQRDLPRGMMYSIIICTILYVLIAIVLTGMVNYKSLAVDDPLAFVFSEVGLNWISGVISISAVIAMTSVLLVFQLGQPRIWMSMSRDGLLPKAFSKVHPRFGTPSFATIVTGLLVGIPIFFIDLNTVVDLCSIGTLFAFILVCGGVLMLHNKKDIPRKFKVPYINGQFIVPILFILTIAYIGNYAQDWANEKANPFSSIDAVPMFIFFIVFATLSFFAIKNKLSLIPVLGILSCLYLMAQIHVHNWIGFVVWLLIGLVIYFFYSYKNSNLNSSKI